SAAPACARRKRSDLLPVACDRAVSQSPTTYREAFMSLFRAAAMALIVAFAPAAHALEGKLVHVKVQSKVVPGPVDIAIYTPPGYDAKRAQAYPLVIQLHGGGGSSDNLSTTIEPFEQAI